MMTLDDIRNVEFSKGRGYRAEEVDDFIDECVGLVEKLLGDLDEANQKIKVLADKVAEYRNEEDSIRSALLNAQRTGDTIVREAQEKANTLLQEANENADAVRRELLEKAENEKQELERVKEEVATFKTRLLELYKDHLAVIRLLPEEPEKTAEQPEEVTEPALEEDDTVVVDPMTEESARIETEEEMKPMSRFTDLKFGSDYDIAEDDAEDEEDDDKPRGLFRKKK